MPRARQTERGGRRCPGFRAGAALRVAAAAAILSCWPFGSPRDGAAAVAAGIVILAPAAALAARLWAWIGRRRESRARAAVLASFRWHRDMTPVEFEECCADYLARMGWRTETTRASGDQGIDVMAVRGRLKVVIQCKLYSRPVGNKAVQEVLAGKIFAGASHAAVVSNQGYTRAARQLASRTGVSLLHFTDLAMADDLFR